MKYHAYVGQRGYVRKSAYQVKAERDMHYRGGPSSEKFFTLHPEGRRKPLEHVRGPGRPFFRYSDGHDDGGPGGPGESLEHLLYKEAVAALTHVRLDLKGYGEHRIVVTHGETEKLIPGTSRGYRSDVYLRFESEDPSELGLKWSGEMYIEIHRTNLVEPEKHDEVRSLNIPMIEVTVPQQLLYRHGGSETTDERERVYVQWLTALLESERGFIKGVMLSNPSSAPYLSKKLAEAQAAFDQQRQQFAAAADELTRHKHANDKLRQSLIGAQATTDSLSKCLSLREAQAASSEKKVVDLTEQLQRANGVNTELAEQLRSMRRAASGMCLAAIGLFCCLVYLWFSSRS